MQTQRTTAGETAQRTNKVWGIVALIAAMAACTCFGSLWLTGISVALFAFSAWKGGYMDESVYHAKQLPANETVTMAEEGVAA